MCGGFFPCFELLKNNYVLIEQHKTGRIVGFRLSKVREKEKMQRGTKCIVLGNCGAFRSDGFE